MAYHIAIISQNAMKTTEKRQKGVGPEPSGVFRWQPVVDIKIDPPNLVT